MEDEEKAVVSEEWKRGNSGQWLVEEWKTRKRQWSVFSEEWKEETEF